MIRSSDLFKKSLLVGLVFVLLGGGLAAALAAERGSGKLVVFSANWCANCRKLLPIVREVASQNGLDMVEIDIDSQDAPRQARNLGIGMPNGDPPQVFYARKGHVTLLFNGQGYRFGMDEKARATILQNLQAAQ